MTDHQAQRKAQLQRALIKLLRERDHDRGYEAFDAAILVLRAELRLIDRKAALYAMWGGPMPADRFELPTPLQDSRLQELFSCAIDHALADGRAGDAAPPAHHWLHYWWQRGASLAQATNNATADAAATAAYGGTC